MLDRNLYNSMNQALKTLEKHFGHDIFDDARRFMAGLNDVVPSDKKTVKNLLRIAICDQHAYTRLKQAYDEDNTFVPKQLEKELSEDYMIPLNISKDVIECIAVFVGFPEIPESPTTTQPQKPQTTKKQIIKPQNLSKINLKVPPQSIMSATMQPQQNRATQIYDAYDSMSSSPTQITITGGTILFGNYKWKILEKHGDKALLLSEKVITDKWFHDTSSRVTWADSSLRRHLNNNFYNSFSKGEQSRIIKVSVANQRNPWFGTDGGTDTTDNIFILSINEAARYFGDSGQIHKKPKNIGHLSDQFSQSRKAQTTRGTDTWWWLRSPGFSPDRAAFISANGDLYLYGSTVYNPSSSGGGIRPALWLKL